VTTKAAVQIDGAGEIRAEALRVLLVDDNASVLRFLVSAVASNNCEVTTASTAEQAMEVLGDAPFDLVVSDIKMPGLSGLDLLRAIKSKQPATPVVLITGVPSVNSAVFGLRHGLRLLAEAVLRHRSPRSAPAPPQGPRRGQRQCHLSRGTQR